MIASTDIPRRQVHTPMLTVPVVRWNTATLIVTTQLVTLITTVVNVVTHSGLVNALLVRTPVLSEKVAWSDSWGAYRHVVLVAAVSTVVSSVADLVAGDAFLK